MKTKVFSLLIVGTVLLAQHPVAIAQGHGPRTSVHDWTAVQAMATDERLIVKQRDGKTIEGRMIEATETNLTLSRNNKVVHISRGSIRQIHQSKEKAAKGKWALIGAGVGGGAGAGIGATKVSQNRDDSEIWLPIGLAIGAGTGAVTGLLFGASRRNRILIYEAP